MSADPYDYLVIGAGSAGCVVAARLADAGHRVLVLEAGEARRRTWTRIPIGYGLTFFDPRVNWCLHTEPDPGLDGRRSYWPRGKGLGGSSAINAMVWYRGLPHDFDDWARQAGGDWSWPAVRTAYEEIERIVHADGHVSGAGAQWITDPGNAYHPVGRHFLDAATALGHAYNPCLTGGEGVGRYCITTFGGRRHCADDAFLAPARRRGGVDVLGQALVTTLLFEGRRARGAAFTLRGAEHKVYCAGEVLLCAGAVASPQLLQLSGIGPGRALARLGIPVRADRPQVGAGLQDHLAVTYFYRARVPTLNNQLRPWWGKAAAALRYAAGRRGPLALGVNQFGGFVRSTPDRPRADLQLYFNPVSYTKTPVGRRPLLRPDPWPGLILSFQPCRPASRGRIELASGDPARPPRIVPGYLDDDADLDAVVRGGRLVAKLAGGEAMRAVIDAAVGPTPEDMDEAAIVADFRARADTVFHPVGSCAMGADPATSVVDARLKVHGFEGLRVIDASVFPNVTSGNTNAPVLMTAWRGAQMVLDDARGQPGAA